MPIVGNVCDAYADEKIATEVEVLSLLRDSNVPVPGIITWGLTAANPLGLGPYIVMDFIEGVSVNTLLRKQHNTRLLRDDICEDDVKFLYRQFARILLQLFQIDFPVLGSLPTPVTGFNAPVRPLTFKAHDILQTGGVDTFGMAFFTFGSIFLSPYFSVHHPSGDTLACSRNKQMTNSMIVPRRPYHRLL
jgi:hypothetical protein